jgi:tetratricopeptide (TPR) repeat protein
MRQAGWVAAVALAAGACAPAAQDRVRDYNEDGIHLFKRGDYAHARETFQAALALQPDDPNLLYNLGRCHDHLGQSARAEQIYRACLARAADHVDCRFALTTLLVRDGRRDEAVRMTEEWLARDPRRATPYAIDGWLWHQYGDLPRAQARLQQALERDPNDPLALTELARVYEEMSRPDRALALYEHALAVRPDQPDVRARLTALQKQGAGRPKPD